jgi:hypothetical protein
VAFQDREEEDGLADVDRSGRDHQERPESQGGLLCVDACEEVGAVDHGGHQERPGPADDEPGQEQRSDQP